MYCKPERQIVFVQKNLCSYKDLARVSESRVAGLGRAGLAELCDAGWWEEGRKGRPRCSLPAGDRAVHRRRFGRPLLSANSSISLIST